MPIVENAITREDRYLAKIAGEDITLPDEPLTRRELYLAKIAGQDVELPEKPITREEQYLARIAKSGIPEGGGGGQDQGTNKLSLFLNATLSEINADDFGDMKTIPSGRLSGYSGIPSSGTGSSANTGALGGFQNVKTITFPETVTLLGTYACWHMNSLEKAVFLSEKMEGIQTGVFAYCTNLKEVSFPENALSTFQIGTYAFSRCSSLESITIPPGTKSIGQNVFYYCTALKEVHMRQSTPPTLGGTNAFANTNSELVIYVPKGSLEKYQAATNWSSFAEQMQEE